ncbi:ABC transporter permease [Actinomadura graeca]|uniref:ABC transporter permease n=1 Tax=Actinomadura graeca TaxID=2750812 RepID=A0ABX8QUQ0_9ACTN|nr:ABC transporter permease [Actinomadura graeca]QXJ22551.1 ABC transporter permease [Actinomadura graeca]
MLRRLAVTYGEPVLVVAVVLGLAELLSRTGVIAQEVLPPLSRVARAFADAVGEGSTWRAIGVSMEAWAIGLLLAVGVAVPAGILIGVSPRLHRLTWVAINLLRPIPVVSAMPLLILVYGLGARMAVVLVLLSAIWPLLLQAIYGVREVDPVARQMAVSYGLGRFMRFRLLVLPSALPSVATGLRVAATIALVLAVAASLVGGGPGLGSEIANAAQAGAGDRMWALIFVTGLLGLLVTATFTRMEAYALRWHQSQRQGHR